MNERHKAEKKRISDLTEQVNTDDGQATGQQKPSTESVVDSTKVENSLETPTTKEEEMTAEKYRRLLDDAEWDILQKKYLTSPKPHIPLKRDDFVVTEGTFCLSPVTKTRLFAQYGYTVGKAHCLLGGCLIHENWLLPSESIDVSQNVEPKLRTHITRNTNGW
jgi:hypothetical protein